MVTAGMEGGKRLLSKEKASIELDTRSESKDRKEDHRETTNAELRRLVSEDQERVSPEIPAERHNERGHVEKQRSKNYRW